MKQFLYFLYISLLCYEVISKKDLFESKLLKIEENMANTIMKVINGSISSLCYDILSNAFQSNTNRKLYLTKLFFDSGKIINDLGSYQDCLYKRYKIFSNQISTIDQLPQTTESIEHNLTFIIYSIKIQAKEFFTQSKLYGICLPKGCNEKDYQIVFRAFAYNTQIETINEDSDIQAYDIKEGTNITISHQYFISPTFIPLYLVLIVFLLSIIPKVILHIVKWISPRKQHKIDMNRPTSRMSSKPEERESRILEYKRQFIPRMLNNLRMVKVCFDISDNTSEIKKNKITLQDINIINDSGLSFVAGLRGIGMIMIVIGLIFEHLNDSPVKLLHMEKMMNFLQSLPFSFIIFCKRFGTRLSYAITGLCLTYKLLCYLDHEVMKLDPASNEYVDNNNEDTDEDTDEDHDDIITNRLEGPTLNDLLTSDETSQYIQHRCKISIRAIVNFSLRQLYKFLLFILFVCFFKYSYWFIIAKGMQISPMWIYMKKELIDKFIIKNIISTLLLYDLFIPDSQFPKNPFAVIINEITYFLFGSVIIFIFYKKNWRLDQVIILINSILSIMKLVIFFSLFFQRDRNRRYYPAKNFTDNYYSFIRKNALYNLPIFLTGVFFGLVNYSYQKGISITNKKINKKMLLIPLRCISFFQSMTKIKRRLCSLYTMSLLTMTVFGFYIIYNLFFSHDPTVNDFFENIYVNLYFLYDIDIAIWSLFLLIFPLCFAGDNLFIYFLNHDYWIYVSRPYFVFVLSCNMVVYYIFYQSDTKIQINFANVAFFGLLAVLLLLILNVIMYVLYDLPLKKLSKLLIYAEEKKREIRVSHQRGLQLSIFSSPSNMNA